MNFKKRIAIFFVVLASALVCLGVFAFGQKETKTDGMDVKAKAFSRIVSLSPAGTEWFFALGVQDKLVARTDFCNYPPEVSKIPSLGGFDGKTFSLESVIAFNPDLVYLDITMHGHLTENLRSLGIKVFESNIESLEDIYSETRALSALLGIEKKGEELIETIKTAYTPMQIPAPAIYVFDDASDEAKKKTKLNRSVYWEVWNDPYMSIGSASFINDIIKEAGGENIFSDVKASYPIVSEESIIARNPRLILLPSDSPETLESLSMRTNWKSIDAIQNKRVVKIDGDLISRPGPRIGEAIRSVQEALLAK